MTGLCHYDLNIFDLFESFFIKRKLALILGKKFIAMSLWKNGKILYIKGMIFFSSTLKSIILLVIFLFNFNCVEGQFWKVKRNVNRIDSLELVISKDRESHKKELNQFSYLTKSLSKKIDSLTLELIFVKGVLDSMKLAEKNEVSSREVLLKEFQLDSSSAFCPDEEMLQQVDYLKDCCCLLDQGCPNKTHEAGFRIIKEGYQMAVVRKDIIVGSCWDFINAVYKNAGFHRSNREVVYKRKKGIKHSSPEILQPGDWIYHVNYSFHNVEHSAIFVCWKDYEKRMGITLSYVGQNKSAPGKYGVYDLSGVYNIKRAKE